MKNLLFAFSALLLVGCHHGKWHDGHSFLYSTDDHYILENGRDCGSVTKSNDDMTYSAWSGNRGAGHWETLEEAKHSVEGSLFCQL